MAEIVRLYFQWPNGTDDQIVLEADSVAEMKLDIEYELQKRGATFTGVETLQQCEEGE